jgi:hypothetical protein
LPQVSQARRGLASIGLFRRVKRRCRAAPIVVGTIRDEEYCVDQERLQRGEGARDNGRFTGCFSGWNENRRAGA